MTDNGNKRGLIVLGISSVVLVLSFISLLGTWDKRHQEAKELVELSKQIDALEAEMARLRAAVEAKEGGTSTAAVTPAAAVTAAAATPAASPAKWGASRRRATTASERGGTPSE